jgi:hypothetical protein
MLALIIKPTNQKNQQSVVPEEQYAKSVDASGLLRERDGHSKQSSAAALPITAMNSLRLIRLPTADRD